MNGGGCENNASVKDVTVIDIVILFGAFFGVGLSIRSDTYVHVSKIKYMLGKQR